MKKLVPLLIIALLIASISRADDGGRIAAGVIAGAATGALVGASGYPVYPPPPPVVYAPTPVYAQPVYAAPLYGSAYVESPAAEQARLDRERAARRLEEQRRLRRGLQ